MTTRSALPSTLFCCGRRLKYGADNKEAKKSYLTPQPTQSNKEPQMSKSAQGKRSKEPLREAVSKPPKPASATVTEVTASVTSTKAKVPKAKPSEKVAIKSTVSETQSSAKPADTPTVKTDSVSSTQASVQSRPMDISISASQPLYKSPKDSALKTRPEDQRKALAPEKKDVSTLPPKSAPLGKSTAKETHTGETSPRKVSPSTEKCEPTLPPTSDALRKSPEKGTHTGETLSQRNQSPQRKVSPSKASQQRKVSPKRETSPPGSAGGSPIATIKSTSGTWVEEQREVSPEVERFLSVSKQEVPAASVPMDTDTITPQSVSGTHSAPPSSSGQWVVESQIAEAMSDTLSLQRDDSTPSMTDNKVVTMELSEPVTEEMTVTASVPVSHQSVTSGSVLTPPTSGAKPKKRQPVEEVMEMETSRVTRSASPVDSAVKVDAPDSAALLGAPDSAAQAQTEEEEEESGSGSGGSVEYSRTQMTETEEVIETEVEETVTMMIVGVVRNPGEADEQVLSMQDAVTLGILDLAQGLYYNSRTRQHISMIEAMNNGWIKMGQAKVEKGEEKVKSMGIITIRTTRETMPYIVKAATNTVTGELLSLEQAADQHILDPVSGVYTDLKSGAKMLIGDAVDQHLVEIEYDTKATGTVHEEVLKTYSVHAVIDQRQRKKLLFHEAVAAGIIDKSTGEYIHNITREKMSAEQAIDRGFIKATLTDNPKELNLDQIGNKTAQRGADAIRKKLLNPLKALRGLKK